MSRRGQEAPSVSQYKILVVGDYAVGKTAVIRRYAHGQFTPQYKLTIGVDFAMRHVTRPKPDGTEENVQLQLWDIAGHERFGTMTHVYYKYAIAAIIVFDLSRSATYDAVLKWKEDIDSKVSLVDRRPIPCILLANKSDREDAVPLESLNLDKFCEDHGFAGWFATSAYKNTGIDEAMDFLLDSILAVAKELDKHEGGQLTAKIPGANTINLNSSPSLDSSTGGDSQAEESSGCC